MANINQGIQDFYRVAQDRDFARDFQFRVLNIQAGDASSVAFDEDDLVYIKSATYVKLRHKIKLSALSS